MHGKIIRRLAGTIDQGLKRYPIVAILGVRQCGKTTLAKALLAATPQAVYLDLERPSDRAKLNDAEAFFTFHQGKLICLDEIQRVPELFPLLRSMVDAHESNGQFLVLGSASRELIKQSSETLAGRIAYFQLTPLSIQEINRRDLLKLWVRGGLPKSFLASNDTTSFEWRSQYIRTFIERDIPQLGFSIPSIQIERFWKMCAHYHGKLVNLNQFGQSMGVSYHTIKSYLHLLEQTFTIRLLAPYASNLKKRLVKSPKLYLRDVGILHNLLSIETYDDLLGHPAYGPSWEGFVIETIITTYPKWQPSFYRTSNGLEIDLILERRSKKIAIECKASSAPQLTRNFYQALDDLSIDKTFIIAPIKDTFPLKNNVMAMSLVTFLEQFIEDDDDE